jgi:hypothetical protein
VADYADRLVVLTFPELSEDPVRDPLWVAIRNPMHVPPARPRAWEGGGEPRLRDAGVLDTVADLIVSWRLYDPTRFDVNPDTGEATQPLLPPPPVTADLVRRLPAPVVDRIMQEVREAADPPDGPGTRWYEDVTGPAESIYDGTWGSGAPPPELVDFELMRQMRWSYRDLQACPDYVKAYCWAFLNARAAAEAEHRKRS